ncbi:MAG: class I SAM-dependent methyltransferase [Proteobacteria bacterium]|nr:class I SAM-dependent methyltransferase [Pseudomonadota bacterium]
MAGRVCPVWIGYLMLNPLRKLMENPERIFGPYIREGGWILEPGCGTGYFTLPLARMAGPEGRVIAVDLQDKMLDVVRRRAVKAGLSERIDLRRAEAAGMGVDDLAGRIDLAVAMHMVHEVPDKAAFFRDTHAALKPGGRLLMVEPRGHTSREDFETLVGLAVKTGLQSESASVNRFSRRAVFVKT